MKIVGLATVTDAILTTNVTEATTAWNSGTTYSAFISVSKGHRIWESQQDSNLNHDPETDDGTWWFDIGPTNDWAMFDDQNDTQSTRADEIAISIDSTGRFDTLALFNISASTVNVTVTDSGANELHNVDYSMVDYTGIANYWDHFFNPVRRKTRLVVEGLPILSGLTLAVTATDTGETVAIGNFVHGRSEYLGATLSGASLDYQNYSKFEADGFGNRAIAPRTYKNQGNFDVLVGKVYVDRVRNTLIAYKDTPALIIATDQYSSPTYFGLVLKATVTISYPLHSILRVQIEDF